MAGALGPALERERELGLEGERRAAADLEAAGRGRRVWPRAEVAAPVIAIGSQLVGLRVNRAGRASRRPSAGRAGCPARIVGQRVGDGVDLGGFGVDVEGGADDDGAEVEGAGDRRGDDRQAERGAFVGAGEVGVCRGRRRGSGRRRRRPSTVPTSEAAGQLGSACSALPAFGAARGCAWAIAASEQ